MASKNNIRTFFVLYSNGDTIYFTVNIAEGEIYCNEFKKMYEKTTNQKMPAANVLEISNNNLNLKNTDDEIIYSLEDYKKEMSKFSILFQRTAYETPVIERIYMDEDIRATLLGLEMVKYDAESSNIPGLLYEPVEVKVHTRVKSK